MKKITKKLSMKYVKLHKQKKLRQDGSMKSEEDGGEPFRESHSLDNAESNETKETPKVTKIMESMHRKLMLKDKANKRKFTWTIKINPKCQNVRLGMVVVIARTSLMKARLEIRIVMVRTSL
ncbi:hypothetical protein AtNW77_Chr1g0066691 [Arabidopsis thaliana]